MSQVFESEVKNHCGHPTLFINGVAQNPMLYALTDVPSGRWSWEERPAHNIRLFAERGFDLFQVDLFLDHVWTAPDRFDLALACKQLRGILEMRPDAAIMIRLHVNAPLWWRDAHPEEWTQYADTDIQHDPTWGLRRIIEFDTVAANRVSLASQCWLDEITPQVARFCCELAASPEGRSVAAFQVAGGIYGEWHYWGFLKNEPDTSPAMTARFRKWLKEKYADTASLCRAWNDPHADVDRAEVPGLDARHTARGGQFRDPQQEQSVIDYYQCQHETVADVIEHFCKVVKASWPRSVVTGAFYGYFFALFKRQAAGGHLAIERLLNSPNIDFLCAPGTYYPQSREVGGAYRARSLIESMRLHGKLWLDEMDQDSEVRWNDQTGYGGSVETAIGIIRRNLIAMQSRGMGQWFYDFGPTWPITGNTGWWDHPDIMEDIRRIKALLDSRVETPYQPEADVLVVYDSLVFYHMPDVGNESLSYNCVDWLTPNLYQAGVIHDPIHLTDLDQVNLSQYKTVVFANTFLLTDSQVNFIREHVAQAGRHLVWLYAPGYTNGSRLDADAVSRVSGLTLRRLTAPAPATVMIDAPDWDSVQWAISAVPLDPFFVVNDPSARPIGHLAELSEVAFARKEMGVSTAWYCSLPIIHAAVWRHLLRDAGCHIYGEQGDVFYSGRGLLAVHTREGGARRLTLKNGTRISLTLAAASTTLMDAETGEVLL